MSTVALTKKPKNQILMYSLLNVPEHDRNPRTGAIDIIGQAK